MKIYIKIKNVIIERRRKSTWVVLCGYLLITKFNTFIIILYGLVVHLRMTYIMLPITTIKRMYNLSNAPCAFKSHWGTKVYGCHKDIIFRCNSWFYICVYCRFGESITMNTMKNFWHVVRSISNQFTYDNLFAKTWRSGGWSMSKQRWMNMYGIMNCMH